MSVFLEIADQYAIADAALALQEQTAFQALDEQRFDRAAKARQRNDQAYFLYLFTRLEAEINLAVAALLAVRTTGATVWAEKRVWLAWSRGKMSEIALLSKVEVLTDKGRHDYALCKGFYEGRNTIAHGDDWGIQLFVPEIAMTMRDVAGRFVRA